MIDKSKLRNICPLLLKLKGKLSTLYFLKLERKLRIISLSISIERKLLPRIVKIYLVIGVLVNWYIFTSILTWAVFAMLFPAKTFPNKRTLIRYIFICISTHLSFCDVYKSITDTNINNPMVFTATINKVYSSLCIIVYV